MQLTNKDFDVAMRKKIRNRGYIKVSIGVVNSKAQNNAKIENTETTYFSENKKPFSGYEVDRVYATAEKDFSKVDGSMYFLPKRDSGLSYYNNGIVTDFILGELYIGFNGIVGLDIKGLTIDFGEYYPTKFIIKNDFETKVYENNESLFVTEDTFDGTSYFFIKPISMVNEDGRLRINKFTCGIANTFSNEKVKSCSTKEYVSPISDSIPSMDTTIVVDNQDLYYSVDNPESAIAYMEIGQEVSVTYGYDVTGDGDIEWLAETKTYLNSWRADDIETEFSSTDRFYQLDEIYYGGLYRPQGINLYNLAVEVLNSAGVTDEREYVIDSYLKKIIVHNPIPTVKHSEALQIIANAGRCVLYEDRANRIHLKSSFVPDMVANSDDKTAYSNMERLLEDTEKKAYAVASNDFSTIDGSLLFLPKNKGDYLGNVGYVSNSVADENGEFLNCPKITINLESGFNAYGLKLGFRNIAPGKFEISTYYENVPVQNITVEEPDLNYVTDERFDTFDKMEITFLKGYPNSRIFIDKILIGDVTNYTICRDDLNTAPTGERQQKVKNIVLTITNYRETNEIKELASEEITVQNLLDNGEHLVYLPIASYGYEVEIKDNENVSAEIVDSSSFFARLRFSGITNETQISFLLKGYEYVAEESYYKKRHNSNGQELSWNNPLISTIDLAKDLEEWLASYYLGDVDYSFSWRGDPRVEANDLFYLELKNRGKTLIQSYENEMEFNGAWSGSMKARKVVL